MAHINNRESSITKSTNQNLKRLSLEKALTGIGLSKKDIDTYYIVKSKTLGAFR